MIGNRKIIIDDQIHGEFHQDALIEFLSKMFIKHEEAKEKVSAPTETQNEI